MFDVEKNPNPSHVSADLKRILKEVTYEARKNKTPIYIAVLAAFLALVSMAEGDTGRLALSSHIESSNQFAFFQAKNIRQTNSEIAADTLSAMNRADLAAEWRQRAERYDNEKKDILATAKKELATRKVALERKSYFEVAIAMLQIAIVLASASLILGGGHLLGASLLLAILATGYTANGYYLFVEFPTEPIAFAKWIMNQLPASGT